MGFLDMCETLFAVVTKAVVWVIAAVFSLACVAMMAFLGAYVAGGGVPIQADEPAWLLSIRIVAAIFGALVGIGFLRTMVKAHA